MIPETPLLFDPFKYNAGVWRNYFNGNRETIDVAARFDSDDDCYGWCTENYLPEKGWRNADWRLPKGRYIVKVTVMSSGEKITNFFQVENFVAKKHFRLMMASQQDISKISWEHGINGVARIHYPGPKDRRFSYINAYSESFHCTIITL